MSYIRMLSQRLLPLPNPLLKIRSLCSNASPGSVRKGEEGRGVAPSPDTQLGADVVSESILRETFPVMLSCCHAVPSTATEQMFRPCPCTGQTEAPSSLPVYRLPVLASLPFLGLSGAEACSPGSFSLPLRRMGLSEGGFVREGKAA